MSDNKYLDRARREISEWESAGPGYLAQVGDFILWPVEKALDTLAPEAVQEAVAKAIEVFLNGLSIASRNLTDGEEIQSRAEGAQNGDKFDMRGLDETAKHYWNWHIAYAVAEGGATGAAGVAGLAADIPALFTIAIRLIQQIATCYGYDVYEENEHECVLYILRAGSTGDIKGKVEFLVGLKQIEQLLLKVAWKQMNEALARKEISQVAALAALRQFAKSIGVHHEAQSASSHSGSWRLGWGVVQCHVYKRCWSCRIYELPQALDTGTYRRTGCAGGLPTIIRKLQQASNQRLEKDLRPARCARWSRPNKIDVFCGYRSNCNHAGFEISHTCLELFTALEVPFGVSTIIA